MNVHVELHRHPARTCPFKALLSLQKAAERETSRLLFPLLICASVPLKFRVNPSSQALLFFAHGLRVCQIKVIFYRSGGHNLRQPYFPIELRDRFYAYYLS